MFFRGIGFWQIWLELLPFALFAFGMLLLDVAAPYVAIPVSILKLTKLTSSAPTTLVGANEKNARQRSSSS